MYLTSNPVLNLRTILQEHLGVGNNIEKFNSLLISMCKNDIDIHSNKHNVFYLLPW